MLVEHFMGQKECDSLEELREVLNERTEKGVNEFIISTHEQFPYMILSVKEKYACLSYFREEDAPGYSSINVNPVLDADGISVFYTNTDCCRDQIRYSKRKHHYRCQLLHLPMQR